MTNAPTIRWGVLATGSIARNFCRDLALVPGNELAAVGSRRPEAAEAFAAEHGATRAYGSYEELVADPEVDVVYVATPHSRHLEDVLLCLDAGKHVLCEKAMTMNASDTERLVAEARSMGLFLAEAMWMRTQPNTRALVEAAHGEAVGGITQLRAELGMVASRDRERLWDPALGASALLDVGIYPLTFAHLLLGEPVGIRAGGVLSDRGIDVNAGAVLTYASGAVATIAWSQVSFGDNRAVVAGPAGRLDVPGRFHEPTGFTVVRAGGEPEQVAHPVVGRGYSHEIEEVAACLRAGRTESTLLPLDETVAIQRQMDEILAQLGVPAR